MPASMLTYRCRNCGRTYPAKVNYTGRLEDIDLDEHVARCPFCSEWNKAERAAVDDALVAAKGS